MGERRFNESRAVAAAARPRYRAKRLRRCRATSNFCRKTRSGECRTEYLVTAMGEIVSMTNRTIGLIMIAALWAGDAAAQELPYGGWDDGATPELQLPVGDNYGPTLAPSGEDSLLLAPPIRPEEAWSGFHPDDFARKAPALHGLFAAPPAPIESTSTWLRRGFWYAEADAVVWNRMWRRDNTIHAAQDQNVNNPNFPPWFANTNRFLILDGAHPGQDAAVRGTLGHFLFRDARNRDHTLEFTAFGGGDWHQHRVITSTVPHQLFVPFFIDGNNRSFDRSSRQELDYSSHFASFELNYNVKQRPRRDQMIMDANGHWHRAANHGFVREYLIGIRLMESRDIFDWRAEDIQVVGDDGTYFIRTDNDMIGFQMGTSLTWETSRWSLGVNGKGGVFINDALGNTTLDFTADDLNDADLRLREDELSFVAEAQVLARWHVTPNFSLRAAYELMLLTSQAAAPTQATFITEFSYLNTSRDIFFHGASFGLEGYW
jgi:hypothetical protein